MYNVHVHPKFIGSTPKRRVLGYLKSSPQEPSACLVSRSARSESGEGWGGHEAVGDSDMG